MPTDNPELQLQVFKLPQQLSTSHQIRLDKVSLWTPLPPAIFSLQDQLPLGVGECSELHWCQVAGHSGHYLTRVVGMPGSVARGQNCWISQGVLHIGVQTKMAPSPQLDCRNVEAVDMQWQNLHCSMSLAVESMWCTMSHPGVLGDEVVPRDRDSNALLECLMRRCSLWYFHSGNHRSTADWYHYPRSSMKSATFVDCHKIHKGRVPEV